MLLSCKLILDIDYAFSFPSLQMASPSLLSLPEDLLKKIASKIRRSSDRFNLAAVSNILLHCRRLMLSARD